VLITARPEFTPPWPSYPHTTTIPLTRLGRRDGTALVLRVTGGKTLPKEVMEHILAHTDGVPLFVEELTKMVLEGGLLQERNGEYVLEGPLPSLAIPTTLQTSLMARLDRLSLVRDVAQIGAVAGREFHYELVNAVAGLPKQRLDEALDQLVRSELLFCRGEIPHAVYTFKHALVRNAAYDGLLKSRRVHLHAAIAKALEQEFPEVVQIQPEIVAYNYTQARNYEKALHYWYEAGKQSAARSAHNEAIGHLKQGLNQIPNIDDPILRNKSELLLQVSLGNSFRAIKGWSTDDVKHASTRALQLCKECGLDELSLPATFGLWSWNFVHASLGEAQALAEHLLDSAENVDNAVCKVLAHEALGFTLFAQGKFAAAHAELERSIGLCEDSKAAAYIDLSAQDPRVHVRLYDGMTLWMLGYPDRALRSCAEARRYADASQHPFSEAIARTIGLRVHQLRGDAAVVADQANAAIAFCEQHEFVHYLAMTLILHGWASAYQGEFEKGIAEIQEGLEKVRATGALVFESYSLGLLADACIKNKHYGQALDFLKQAQLRLDEENCERFYAAEIYRLLGEAHLQLNQNLDQAEYYFCKGLQVAREQKAKSFELRVCLSICDLYELRPDADKCRSQLDQIYRSFSEGFDTFDLVRAKARLKHVR
jgi:predicted ATPase